MNGSLYLPRQTETPAKMSHGHLQAVNYFIIFTETHSDRLINSQDSG